MPKIEYRVYSVDTQGVDVTEGYCPTIEETHEWIQMLAKEYSENADNTIVHIKYEPICRISET